jgi:hypothetical protein
MPHAIRVSRPATTKLAYKDHAKVINAPLKYQHEKKQARKVMIGVNLSIIPLSVSPARYNK